VGKVVFLPTFAAAGGQPEHAAHPTENVKIFMRTYLPVKKKKYYFSKIVFLIGLM